MKRRAYVVPSSVAHMMSDPMWVLSENIVIDNIAKKVAEAPVEDWIIEERYEDLRFPAKWYAVTPNGAVKIKL
tara:strand:- start:95 stop:313 length:219 start_codon:yes stop_codon:yes gene_type:complete